MARMATRRSVKVKAVFTARNMSSPSVRLSTRMRSSSWRRKRLKPMFFKSSVEGSTGESQISSCLGHVAGVVAEYLFDDSFFHYVEIVGVQSKFFQFDTEAPQLKIGCTQRFLRTLDEGAFDYMLE